jgi:hypothetical protein
MNVIWLNQDFPNFLMRLSQKLLRGSSSLFHPKSRRDRKKSSLCVHCGPPDVASPGAQTLTGKT